MTQTCQMIILYNVCKCRSIIPMRNIIFVTYLKYPSFQNSFYLKILYFMNRGQRYLYTSAPRYYAKPRFF